MNIRFASQSIGSLNTDALAVAVGLDVDADLAKLDAAMGGHLLPYAHARSFKGKPGTTLTVATMGRLESPQLILVGVGDGSASAIRTAAGHAGRAARAMRASSLALDLGDLSSAAMRTVIELVHAGNYTYQVHKPKSDHTPELSELVLLAAEDASALSDAQVRARWQVVARDLVNGPADEVHPQSMAATAIELLSGLPGVTVEIWDYARLQAENCVGICAVGQGSDRKPNMIRIQYRPANAEAHVALVGKGVTFDSGGLSLKPSAGMLTMRCDMGGAATMLAATGAIAELGLPVAVDTFLGCAENMTAGNAYKLGDVLEYRNGVTVEIHNTDAEGRLVLADCLIEASKVEGATHLIDAATLTGACVVAVGGDFTAVFTSDDAFAGSLASAANTEGEFLWRLPLHKPYNRMLKSDYAQLKNVGGREAGSTTAALFLEHFVDGPAWAHLDIAGSAFADSSRDYWAPGGTGQMVRTLISWAEGL